MAIDRAIRDTMDAYSEGVKKAVAVVNVGEAIGAIQRAHDQVEAVVRSAV